MTNDPLPASTDATEPRIEATPVPAPARVERRRVSFWASAAVVALIIALVAALYAHYQLAALRMESARRLTELELSVARSGEVANRADAEARAARERAALLESKLGEEQEQREALQQLYADLSRGRDDAVLVDVERLITMASQELAISGNVNTALAALQTADARLARVDNARFLPLRRLLARDIERLKVAPTVDVTGIALKLDQLMGGAENWPLLAEAKAPAGSASTAADPDAPTAGSTRWERIIEKFRSELGEYRDLIRIRRVETQDGLLLSQAQQQLVRQQLKLRLFDARQALVARNDRLYRADMGEALALMARYVDVRSPAAGAAFAQIKQLAAIPLSVDVPNINDSVAAVRAARPAAAR
ncbi:MAG: uroporphyrinogen-III C-methyltransferase [Burkholderiaceae bacterium]